MYGLRMWIPGFIRISNVLFDVRGFNDSKTFWLYRLIFIVRMSLMVKRCRHIDYS